jgi:hypothetical protein
MGTFQQDLSGSRRETKTTILGSFQKNKGGKK